MTMKEPCPVCRRVAKLLDGHGICRRCASGLERTLGLYELRESDADVAVAAANIAWRNARASREAGE
jgi:hypothetical protein